MPIFLPFRSATPATPFFATTASAPALASIMYTQRSFPPRAFIAIRLSGVVSEASRWPASSGAMLSPGPEKLLSSTSTPAASKKPFSFATKTGAKPAHWL